MDPNGSRILLGAADAAGAEILIGTFLEGGYFAGYISHTADGNATHGLIVAPAASGYFGGFSTQWKTSNTSSPDTSSEYDGAANTANMADASHPAANYCDGLSIGGYSDWYLPARYELDIAYYNLKPTTNSNNTSWGINDYSVPKRTVNYTSGDPAQTSVTVFQTGNSEAFSGTFHWSSTESSSTNAWLFDFTNGQQLNVLVKANNLLVRAFRKFAL